MKNVCFLIFLLVLAACNEVVRDHQDPIITSLAVSPKTVSPGQTLIISYGVKDNEELSQVRARITTAFSKSFGGWRVLRIDDLGGKHFNGEMHFPVPDSALAGLYAIAFQAADARGNGTLDSLVYFTLVQEDIAPVIESFETFPPLVDGVFMGGAQAELNFHAVISDNDGLARIELDLQNARRQVLGNVSQTADSLHWYEWNFEDTLRFSDFSQLPTRLVLKATNLTGHQTRLEVDVANPE